MAIGHTTKRPYQQNEPTILVALRLSSVIRIVGLDILRCSLLHDPSNAQLIHPRVEHPSQSGPWLAPFLRVDVHAQIVSDELDNLLRCRIGHLQGA